MVSWACSFFIRPLVVFVFIRMCRARVDDERVGKEEEEGGCYRACEVFRHDKRRDRNARVSLSRPIHPIPLLRIALIPTTLFFILYTRISSCVYSLLPLKKNRIPNINVGDLLFSGKRVGYNNMIYGEGDF